MLSNVDMRTTDRAEMNDDRTPNHASILNPEVISRGLTVSRVVTGKLVVSAHRGEDRIVFDVTAAELREFCRAGLRIADAG